MYFQRTFANLSATLSARVLPPLTLGATMAIRTFSSSISPHRPLVVELAIFTIEGRCMRTYESFIEEMRALREEIGSLRKEPRLARSAPFKTWNHSLCMLIGDMRKNG